MAYTNRPGYITRAESEFRALLGILTGLKQCGGVVGCYEWKPLCDFGKDASCMDGLKRQCAECLRARARESYAADPDAAKKGREYRQAHPEQARASVKKHRNSHREEFRAYRRQYASDHLDACQKGNAKYRARKRGAEIVETVDRRVVADRAGWICALCELPIDPDAPFKLPDGRINPAYLHADHIVPLSKGGNHTYDNHQPSHAHCNWHKRNSENVTPTEIRRRLDACDNAKHKD